MTTNIETAPWEQPGYSSIASATRRDEEVEVVFAGGDVVHLPVSAFGVSGDWTVELDTEHTGAVVFAIDAQRIEASWEQIRALDDPAFAAELRRRDTDEARRIGFRLKAIREDKNISQRDLASMVGMSPPQLSKIEAGAFDLRLSTLRSILRAMNSSFADITGADVPEIPQRTLRQRAARADIPGDVMDRLFERIGRRQLATALERLLGWTEVDLRLDRPPVLSPEIAIAFKGAHPDATRQSAQLRLAYSVTKLLARAMPHELPGQAIPSIEVLRSALGAEERPIAFAQLLTWALEAGVVVAPVYGKGAFSAAVWNVDGRPSIVLKETRRPAVFWLFDLAHELGHLANGHVNAHGLVEVDDLSPQSSSDAQEEKANEFALWLLLGSPDTLIAEVRAESRGSHLRFKGAVLAVAKSAKVSPGLLGMVCAYALPDIGQAKDRWGSAQNLASADGMGREIAETQLRMKLHLENLDEFETALVSAVTGI